MILLDDRYTYLQDATPVIGLERHYSPAHIIVTRTSGEIGSFDRLPVRLRVERGGFITITVLSVEQIATWFGERSAITATLVESKAIQSWIVLIGVVENNLFNTVGDSNISDEELHQWITAARLAGCPVVTMQSYTELNELCSQLNDTLANNGEVLERHSIQSLLSTIPHVGVVADGIVEYTGSVWAALAFLSNRDLFNTLPTSPLARKALGDGTFTREHHKEVRRFLGMESSDFGLGLYIDEEE